MNTRSLAAGLLTGLAAAAAWPQAPVRWLEKDYDFGIWKEAAGPRTGQSRFVNTGPETISILDVKPSCGCTSASFTETPLAPGDTAVIRYTYDPTRRPGRFQKSVKVRLSDGSRQVITITGSVIGTPESLKMLYPVEAGKMFLTELRQPENPLPYGGTTSYFVNVYNAGPDSISPVARSGSKGMRVERASGAVGPGDVATFGIYFDSRRHGVMGPVEIPIEFRADSIRAEAGSVVQTFRAVVLPDTSRPAADAGRDAPRIVTDPDAVDLGNVAELQTGFGFRIGNEGRNPLKIYRVYSGSDAVDVLKYPSKEVKRGKWGKVECHLDISLLPSGPFRFNVYVITDDPVTPLREVRVVGIKID